MAKLKIIWPDSREQEYEISRTVTMIGRTSDNDLKLVEKGISRKQCKIEGAPGTYSVVDLDSKNGTMVNGVKISTSQLRHNDAIVIGAIRIIFMEDESTRMPSAPAPAKPGANLCPSCGGPIKDGDVLCVKCGTFIKKEKSLFTGKTKPRDNWAAWSLLLLVLGVILAVVFMMSGKSEAPSPDDPAAMEDRMLEIIRDTENPVGNSYGALLDRLNVSNSDLEWEITPKEQDMGLQMYRVVVAFTTENGFQKLVFSVDLASGLADDLIEDEEFLFSDF